MFFGVSEEINIIEINIFLTKKEQRDYQLFIELRTKGIINTPNKPFVFSRHKEINRLEIQGVYKIINQSTEELKNTRIFRSRLVDEVKNKEIAAPYKKSRLVIQAWNNKRKKEILI
jgi:hypothetical protein